MSSCVVPILILFLFEIFCVRVSMHMRVYAHAHLFFNTPLLRHVQIENTPCLSGPSGWKSHQNSRIQLNAPTVFTPLLQSKLNTP
jgi:hypothetical protein